ncbi:hypothetical protein GQ55_9G066300 [Panicum hallii var. hallii]|uniref:Uncharacterized protein n=1 Tax=Panicum hallii var. hallii TaxID=1504633 RepID=A0A2T7C0G1_9POAL|nr:hypothetical protein GQ55_9G066300 [Panicum hallii var. hallii]
MCIAHLVTGRAAPTVTPQCAVVSVVPTMCSTKCHFHGKFSCGVASRIVCMNTEATKDNLKYINQELHTNIF